MYIFVLALPSFGMDIRTNIGMLHDIYVWRPGVGLADVSDIKVDKVGKQDIEMHGNVYLCSSFFPMSVSSR